MSRISSAIIAVPCAGLLLSGCAALQSSSSVPSPNPTTVATSCVGGSGPTTPATPPSSNAHGIIAHGSCTIISVPDTATVAIAVQTQGITARAALDATNTRADAVISGIKAKGINPADIHSGTTAITPVYSPIIRSLTGVGGTRVTGFTAARSITATLHNLTTSGPVLQGVTDSTGDSGTVAVTYSTDDNADLRTQARTAAVHRAQDAAKQIAAASGVALGNLVSITDVTQPPPIPPSSAPSSGATASTSGSDQTPQASSSLVLSGNDGQEVQASVDVTYATG